MKRHIFSILFAMIFMTQFSFAQELPKAPTTIDEARSFGLRIITELPRSTILAWQEQVAPIFQDMWVLAQKPLRTAQNKILQILSSELEKRKPDIQKEFQKEKEEMRLDIPKTIDIGKSLYERLKELFE